MLTEIPISNNMYDLKKKIDVTILENLKKESIYELACGTYWGKQILKKQEEIFRF